MKKRATAKFASPGRSHHQLDAKNLELRVAAENGATKGKTELAKLAKAEDLTPYTTPSTRWRATSRTAGLCASQEIFREIKPIRQACTVSPTVCAAYFFLPRKRPFPITNRRQEQEGSGEKHRNRISITSIIAESISD